MTATAQREQMITRAAIKDRGWTDAMIRDLLGTPDASAPNPYSSKAAPMQLYRLDRVLNAEAGPVFAQRREKAEKRAAASRRVADRRREQLLEAVDAIEVNVPVIEWPALVRLACDSYKSLARWCCWRGTCEGHYASPDSDPAFIDRIVGQLPAA